MAGWLAWNLRIITGVAIACCAYIGTDYLSNKDNQRNIERLDFLQDHQWPEEAEGINLLQLGTKNPDIAKKRFEKMSSGNGGTVLGLDRLIEAMEKRCAENPHTVMHDPDLSTRRHCRLYWNVKDSIDILIKTENEHVLLSSTDNSDDTGWKAAWEKYKKTSPWEAIEEEPKGQVPAKLKALCETKSKESVHDIDDDRYRQVVEYCTRDKTIKDALGVNFKLLSTDGSGNTTETWKTRFDDYAAQKIGARLHKDITQGEKDKGYSRLMEACKEAIELKTTINNYKSVLRAVQSYCKE